MLLYSVLCAHVRRLTGSQPPVPEDGLHYLFHWTDRRVHPETDPPTNGFGSTIKRVPVLFKLRIRYGAHVSSKVLYLQNGQDSYSRRFRSQTQKAILQAFSRTWLEFYSAFSINGIAENKHRQNALMSAVVAREGDPISWRYLWPV
jgi:hypothetical protein